MVGARPQAASLRAARPASDHEHGGERAGRRGASGIRRDACERRGLTLGQRTRRPNCGRGRGRRRSARVTHGRHPEDCRARADLRIDAGMRVGNSTGALLSLDRLSFDRLSFDREPRTNRRRQGHGRTRLVVHARDLMRRLLVDPGTEVGLCDRRIRRGRTGLRLDGLIRLSRRRGGSRRARRARRRRRSRSGLQHDRLLLGRRRCGRRLRHTRRRLRGGSRDRRGRGRRRGGRRRRPRGEERERIEVAVLVARETDAEMHGTARRPPADRSRRRGRRSLPPPRLLPVRTSSEPRCVSVTLYPSGVRMLSVSPLPGGVPANVTTPSGGATTGAPAAPRDVDPPVLAGGARAAYGRTGTAAGRAPRPATSTPVPYRERRARRERRAARTRAKHRLLSMK